MHDELCKDPKCRLRKGMLKKDDLVASSVLMYALREQGFARQFQTFAAHLRIGNEEKEKFRAEVGQVFGLVKEHLKQFEAKNYTCAAISTSMSMSRIPGLCCPASAARAVGWPRLTGAWGSLERDLALREASGAPAG